MSSKARNLLFLMSDEHQRDAVGCYGHPFVQTPNLDLLASKGTRFDRAYTPSPICVPARASLATGRYVHQHRYWSNAQAYDGAIASWSHRLRDAGYTSVSIGKLHFRSCSDDNGFSDEIMPLHIRNGLGWTRGLLRKELTDWDKAGDFANEIGPGECDYTHYDRAVSRSACQWIKDAVSKKRAEPWSLFVSFVSPHYPLMVPEKFYSLYPLEQVGLAAQQKSDVDNLHPVVDSLRSFFNYDDYFDDHSRKVARAAYFGLCTFMDELIGDILYTLEASGEANNTTIIYCSDHGECLGNRGIWTKCVLYEESTAIPLIVSGPGIPEKMHVSTPCSLIDCYPTILENANLALDVVEQGLSSESLFKLADSAYKDRPVISEYHDGGSVTGMFMLRYKNWKYNYYPGYRAELFDMDRDPGELNDLSAKSKVADILQQCQQKLLEILDPDKANELAFDDQAKVIESLGGAKAILTSLDYDHSPVPS